MYHNDYSVIDDPQTSGTITDFSPTGPLGLRRIPNISATPGWLFHHCGLRVILRRTRFYLTHLPLLPCVITSSAYILPARLHTRGWPNVSISDGTNPIIRSQWYPALATPVHPIVHRIRFSATSIMQCIQLVLRSSFPSPPLEMAAGRSSIACRLHRNGP